MKLADNLVKVNDSVTLYRYDNGYMIEVGGQDKNEDWITRKIVCNDLKQVLTIVEEFSKLPLS